MVDNNDSTTTTAGNGSPVAADRRERADRLYRLLAGKVAARLNCINSGNGEWFARHTEAIETIARELLPRGSGIDSGTSVDLDRSTADKLVLQTSFHHMNDGGYYDGWTEHTITVRPSLIGTIDVSIGGRDRNGIKDYLGETFHYDLTRIVVESYDPTSDRLEYRYGGGSDHAA